MRYNCALDRLSYRGSVLLLRPISTEILTIFRVQDHQVKYTHLA